MYLRGLLQLGGGVGLNREGVYTPTGAGGAGGWGTLAPMSSAGPLVDEGFGVGGGIEVGRTPVRTWGACFLCGATSIQRTKRRCFKGCGSRRAKLREMVPLEDGSVGCIMSGQTK